MNLSEQLKLATRNAHEETENHSFLEDIRSQSLTPSQYHQLLHINYLFHEIVTSQIEKWFTKKPSYKLNLRIRVSHLIQDLKSLGQEVLSHDFRSELNSFPEALGALYVLEGSTLGGRLILKAALKTPGVKESGAHKFYEGYGDETGRMWMEIINQLNAETFSDQERQETINGALKTFALYREIAEKMVLINP